MFTAPTAIRVLKKQDPKYLRAARPVEPAPALSRRRAARRADRVVDRRRDRQAGHRQLLADRERLADPDRRQRRRRRCRASTAARACRCTATTSRLVDEATGLDIVEPGREGRRRDRRADAARLHADRLARRRALRRDLLDEHRRAPALQHLRLGHPRRRRLLVHPRPHRRRHQRRRPPPRHARDRGEHLEPCQRRRGRGRRRRRCAEGPGRDGVRRSPRTRRRSATPTAG